MLRSIKACVVAKICSVVSRNLCNSPQNMVTGAEAGKQAKALSEYKLALLASLFMCCFHDRHVKNTPQMSHSTLNRLSPHVKTACQEIAPAYKSSYQGCESCHLSLSEKLRVEINSFYSHHSRIYLHKVRNFFSVQQLMMHFLDVSLSFSPPPEFQPAQNY